VVSFTPRPFYPRERATGTRLMGRWVGPRAIVDAVVKRTVGKAKEVEWVEKGGSKLRRGIGRC
jgi:hypothetical protein